MIYLCYSEQTYTNNTLKIILKENVLTQSHDHRKFKLIVIFIAEKYYMLFKKRLPNIKLYQNKNSVEKYTRKGVKKEKENIKIQIVEEYPAHVFFKGMIVDIKLSEYSI